MLPALGFIDVERHARHANGLPALVPLADPAAIHDPAPAIVIRADPIGAVEHVGLAGNGVRFEALQFRQVIGMHRLVAFRRRAFEPAGGQAEQLHTALVEDRAVPGRKPGPGPDARAPCREFEQFTAGGHLLLGPFLSGDVHEQAQNPGAGRVLRVHGLRMEVQPPQAVVRQGHADDQPAAFLAVCRIAERLPERAAVGRQEALDKFLRAGPSLVRTLSYQLAHRLVSDQLAGLRVPLPDAKSCHPHRELPARLDDDTFGFRGQPIRHVARDQVDAASLRVIEPADGQGLQLPVAAITVTQPVHLRLGSGVPFFDRPCQAFHRPRPVLRVVEVLHGFPDDVRRPIAQQARHGAVDEANAAFAVEHRDDVERRLHEGPIGARGQGVRFHVLSLHCHRRSGPGLCAAGLCVI